MLRTSTRLILILGLLALAACGTAANPGAGSTRGSGNVITETREVSGFSSISYIATGELVIEQGDTESLTIEGEDNILPLLTSEVQNGVLNLHTTPNASFSTTRPVIYRLTVINLDALTVSGSSSVNAASLNLPALSVNAQGSTATMLGNVTVENEFRAVLGGSATLEADNVTSTDARLDVEGSAVITVDNLSTGVLSVEVDNSGTVTAAGSAAEQRIVLTGSATYSARNLSSADVVVNASDSSSAVVNVSGTLDATISSSASVQYAGQPTAVQETDNSTGDIQPVQ